MASEPTVRLKFRGSCPDCAVREVELPPVLPDTGDDFDWGARDYDGFRMFMLQELAARFPERTRWTPADLEVVIAEVWAAALDQISDMLDRVAQEAYLETARRPESVRRLLSLIGYDVLEEARALGDPPFDEGPLQGDTRGDAERFDDYWLQHPARMDEARRDGPRRIRTQHRMVTLDDYATRLGEHPLVRRAKAISVWSGSWPIVRIAVIPWRRVPLDEKGTAYGDDLRISVERFHLDRGLHVPEWTQAPTLRSILDAYVDAYRMIAQEVELADAQEVGVVLGLSLQVDTDYFRSEVRQAVDRALGTGPGGFFEVGRLRFGEDLYVGDIYETLMKIQGVSNVCVDRFKRVGTRFPEKADQGRITLDGLEIAVCEDDPRDPSRGYYRLRMYGGRRG